MLTKATGTAKAGIYETCGEAGGGQEARCEKAVTARPGTGIALGMTATDVITGFKGVVTCVCYYLSGCNQALLMPKVGKDGGYGEGHWFDFQRLVVDPKVPAIVLFNDETPGFDQPAPKR